jgi:hypothetical protein
MSEAEQIFVHASLDDIDFLLEGFRATHFNITSDDELKYRQRLQEDIFNSSPLATVFILKKGDDKAGYVVYSPCYFVSTGLVWWISQIYIDPKYRGFYFKKVFNSLKELASKNNVKSLIWCTHPDKDNINQLWLKADARNLNSHFIFWSKKL